MVADQSPQPPAAPSPAGGAPGPTGRYRVRWDRVGVLVVLVALVVVAAVHAVAGRRAEVVPAPDRPPVHRTAKVATNPATKPAACPKPSHAVVRSAPARGHARTVALTFDDGPGPWTPKVLAVLHQQQVHATFFVIGRWAAANPRLLRSVVAGGNELGNHSWSHHVPRATVGWRAATLTRELHRTDRAVAASTGHRPCFFRPPGGVYHGARAVTRADGLSVALWSVDTLDWSIERAGGTRSAASIRRRARAGLSQQHPVVLLHDGGGYRGATVAALPGIIADYRAHGYRFVTLSGRP